MRGDDNIVKPVDSDSFVEAVRQLGMYRLLLNEAPVVSVDLT